MDSKKSEKMNSGVNELRWISVVPDCCEMPLGAISYLL